MSTQASAPGRIQIDDETTLSVEAQAGMVLLRLRDDHESAAAVLSVDEATALIAELERGIAAAFAQRRQQMTEGT